MEGDELTNHSTEIRKIVARGTTEIDVIYTDDSYEASKHVDMYEQWLSTNTKMTVASPSSNWR
jgi:hypothetical protein